MADKKDLMQKAYSLKAEISKLKRELSNLNASRRELYGRQDTLWDKFNPAIAKIKELREKRDEHTASVKELKSKRQSATSVARDAFSILKKLRTEKDKKSSKLGVKMPAAAILHEIKKLDYKIETDIIPFEVEQKLNKIIRGKKADLEKAKQLSDVVEKLRESSKKLHHSKSTSNQAHRELQLHASVSQKLHEEMLSFADQANDFKSQIKNISKEKKGIRNKYVELKKQLQEKIASLESVSTEITRMREEKERQRKLAEEKLIEKNENELTKKIKSGKKLTNADLIKLQLQK